MRLHIGYCGRVVSATEETLREHRERWEAHTIDSAVLKKILLEKTVSMLCVTPRVYDTATQGNHERLWAWQHDPGVSGSEIEVFRKFQGWDSPAGPAVSAPGFHCRGAAQLPGRRSKSPHAARHGPQI